MDIDTMMQEPKIIPNNVFILPLQQKPLFPGLFTPLLITGENDIESVTKAIEHGGLIGTLLEKKRDENVDLSTLSMDDRFYRVGTLCRILKSIKLPDGGLNIYISTLSRFEVISFYGSTSYTVAQIRSLPDKENNSDRLKAWVRSLNEEFKKINRKTPLFSDENRLNMVNINNPSRFADYMASILNEDGDKLQEILEMTDVRKRIELVLFYIGQERKIAEMQATIQEHVNKKLEKNQRDYFLKEELKQIQKELGITADKSDMIQKLKASLDALNLKGEAKDTVDNEFARFTTLETNSPEYSISLTYLQTIASLPWKDEGFHDFDLAKVRRILDKDHYGLDDVKDRIMEFLAVRKKKQDAKGAIICLVGPPGVGKTSIGQSIARAMGKKLYRFSVGGMRDEAEIKGHRRTYIGALPGKIIQGLKIVKTNSPVFLIDEIDKMGQSYQGDPASALLEVLDPEQNKEFRDRYLDIPFDISKVLFIVTANTLDTIPSPLLDRMEVIELSGYTSSEKLNIGKKYLLPKSFEKNGLTKEDAKYPSKSLLFIAEQYAREAGVRHFEKSLDRINRKIALDILTGKESELPITVNEEKIEKFLGKPIFPADEYIKADKVGTALGLAWTSMGGDVLLIEAENYPGKGELKVTGQLGDVMKESVSIAWTYLQREAERRNIDHEWFEKNNVHLHIPEGAVPKDGPSAGVTLTTALYSLLTNQVMEANLAMTGELTLTGKVMPIGGLKEKVLAAKRNGVKTILIPANNKRDLDKLTDEVKSNVTFHLVSDIQEVLHYAFPLDKSKRMSEDEYLAKVKADEKKKDEKEAEKNNEMALLITKAVVEGIKG